MKVLYQYDALIPRRRDPAALVGSAIHRTIDANTKDPRVDPVRFFEQSWTELLATRNFREARLTADEGRLERARRFVWSISLPRHRSHDRIASEVSVRSSSGRVVGTIDRIRRGTRGEPQLFEVKTGANTAELLTTYRDQLISYAYLLAEQAGEFARQGALLFVLARASVRVRWTREDISAQGAALEEAASEVQAVEAATVEHGRVGDECTRCDFRPWCPAFWRVYSKNPVSLDLTKVVPGVQLQVRDMITSKGQVLLVGLSEGKHLELLVSQSDYPQAGEVSLGSVVRATDVIASPPGPLRLRMIKGSELFVSPATAKVIRPKAR